MLWGFSEKSPIFRGVHDKPVYRRSWQKRGGVFLKEVDTLMHTMSKVEG